MNNDFYLDSVYCPKCGQTQSFNIGASAFLRVSKNGIELAHNHQAEWNDGNPIECVSCDHSGVVGDFTLPGLSVTCEITTPEEKITGWWVPHEGIVATPPESPAYVFDPKAFNQDQHASMAEAIIEWAVAVLEGEAAVEPNCTTPEGIEEWTARQVIDPATGKSMRKTFHFYQGFGDKLKDQINHRMHATFLQ